MSITEQLDNGIRFVDYRLMFEYTDENPDWYSLHFLQSISPSTTYLKEIRKWIDAHPEEIIVLWFSKHGSECKTGEDQYPSTSVEEKQKFWAKVEEIFSGLLPDFTSTRINETSVSEMVKLNARIIIYASDYKEFTGSSQFALDGCLIDNNLGPSVDDEPSALEWELQQFQNARDRKIDDKADQKLYLMSMATGVPSEQVIGALRLKWGPSDQDVGKRCVEAFNVPGLDWCPETLLEVACLENYYKQISLEEALMSPELDFPNAIYLNALDWEVH